MPHSLKISASLFDHCFSDFVADWTGIVIGVEGYGQTTDQMIEDVCAAVARETDDDRFPYGDYAYELLREALRDELAEDARFWPVDAAGHEVDTDANPDTELPEEQPSYWFRIKVERDPLAIRLSQSADDDGSVIVYCEDKRAAADDQSIDGSHWECPGDMNEAYAAITDRPTLVEELTAAGYDVDDSDYAAPTAEDMVRWSAQLDV